MLFYHPDLRDFNLWRHTPIFPYARMLALDLIYQPLCVLLFFSLLNGTINYYIYVDFHFDLLFIFFLYYFA